MDFVIGEKKQKPIVLLPIEKRVHITLETQEEIDQLYAMLNYAPIAKALNIYNNDWFSLKQSMTRSDNYLAWHTRLCIRGQ